MNSRERTRKALYFEGPDHIPHYLPDDKENDILWLWLERPAPKMDWKNYGDTDYMTDAWGTTFYRKAGGVIGRGELYEPAIPDITRQQELVFPHMNNPAFYEEPRRLIEENNASDNPKYCLGVMNCGSLNEGMHNLIPLQDLFMAYYENPDDVKGLLKRLSDEQKRSIRMLREIGCDGVMAYDDWGLQDRLMIGRDIFEEFFAPHYRENWGLAHELGMDVWLHSCGYIIDLLPDFIDYGLNVIQQDQQENMGLENLDAVAGGELAFWCPVDIQNTMVYGSIDDVRKYVKRMMDTLGNHNGGLISMAYSTPEDVQHSPEKIAAMCEAFREYGVYEKVSGE